jgi:hypothetical protein
MGVCCSRPLREPCCTFGACAELDWLTASGGLSFPRLWRRVASLARWIGFLLPSKATPAACIWRSLAAIPRACEQRGRVVEWSWHPGWHRGMRIFVRPVFMQICATRAAVRTRRNPYICRDGQLRPIALMSPTTLVAPASSAAESRDVNFACLFPQRDSPGPSGDRHDPYQAPRDRAADCAETQG